MPVNIFAAGHGVCGRMRAVLLVTAILILCSAPVIAAQRITQVQVANLDGKVQIAVAATEPITVNVKQSQVGKFLAFDIRGYYSPVRSGKVSIASGKIYNVRYGRFRTNPHVARIALATRGKLTYTTRFIKDRTSMIIDVWKAGKSMAKQSPKPHLALAMAPAVRSIPLVTRTPSPQTVVRATDTRIAQPVVIRPVEVDEQPTEIKPVLVAAAPTSPARIIRRAGQPVEDTVSPSPQRNISLDFVSAEINDVLKALSVQSGANIVSGADVKGQITVSLNRASLEQALDYVAKLSGYKYAKAGQETYLVGNNVGAAMVSGSDTVVTEAITLRLVTPDDALVKMLNAMWPNVKIAFPKPNEAKETEDTGNVGPGHLKVIAGKAYKLTPPKPLSTVLLNGPSGEVVMVKEAIQKMEDSLGQRSDGSITQVYRVKSGNVTQLIKLVNQVVPVVSVSWATDAFKLEGGDLGNQPDYIVLTGPEQQVNEAIELLNQVDTKPSQILIEAKVVDVMNDALRDIGVDWSWSTFSSRGSVDISNVKSNPTELPETAADDARIVTRALAIGPVDLLAKLNLMVSSSKAKLLANPKVATLEGKPSNIFIGDQIKYIISIQNTTTGPNILTETANIGIGLRAIGTVGPDNEITLNLHPEVSVISSFLNLGNGIALPQIATRFTDSTIRIKSGETIVIGGLIRDQDILTMSKVPFLGDLPFLGQLFQHKSKTKNHSEVVIFVTATVLD